MMLTNDGLRLMRLRLRLTQLEMARETGYSVSYIRKLEQGTLPITEDFENRVYHAFNLETRFRRSYNRPHPQKTDWGAVVCFAVFFAFIILFMVINR